MPENKREENFNINIIFTYYIFSKEYLGCMFVRAHISKAESLYHGHGHKQSISI